MNMTENEKIIATDYIWDKSSLIVMRFDSEGNITSMNSYACKFLGETFIGRPFCEILVDFNHQFDMEQFRSTPGIPRMLNFSTVNGMPISLRVTCFTNADGGIIIGEQDMLELQELRTTMLDINQNMGNISRELQKKNAELQQLNNLKNQFLGMAAHDLRNPISTIITYTKLYLEDSSELTPEMTEVLTDIRSLSDFMLHMVTQLLDVSVIEMGKLVLEKHMVEILPFISDTIKLNGLLAQKKGISLKQEFNCNQKNINCDRHKIKQVMNNLISNAIKFSAENTVITVKVNEALEDLRFEVCDHGPGIPVHEQNRLFKPFGVSSVRPSAGEQSTGLGLAISRRIVESHGGQIGLKSSLGNGSTFWFTIPFVN